MRHRFRKLADRIADAAGSPWAFMGALGLTVVWLILGPIFHFSDTWQLIMNTVTNVLTFPLLFLLQSTQNRDSSATQIKLDELLRVVAGARPNLVSIENLSDEELDQLEEQFERLRQRSNGKKQEAARAIEEELERKIEERTR
ncbi:MAG TPA: low affinity iron permease family protein [Chthonomonadaceae bacterium]|nr:low affinity iron permease family protein [Chthonomonadaceae bacterium]